MKGKIFVLYKRGAGMGRGLIMSDDIYCQLSMLIKKRTTVIVDPKSELDGRRIEDYKNGNAFCIGKSGKGTSIHLLNPEA